MPICEYAASGMLPLLAYGLPTLPLIDPPVGRYPSRKNQTLAPTPPRIIGLRSDVYVPLDHTSPHHPLLPGSFIAAAATAMPGKKGSSVGSLEEKWYACNERKWDDGDADMDVGDNLHVNDGLSDKSDYKPPGDDDDSLFYSSKENKEFERKLEEVARVIKYLDPKHIRHGRRQTTAIMGGPVRPNYEGMTVMEKQFAKDEYEHKRKVYTNQKRAKRLKEAALHTEYVEYTGCLHPTLQTMVEAEKSRLKVGQTFPNKELLKLHVAKEANCRGINFYMPCNEVRQYKAYGEMFAVEANNNEMTNGFYVSICSVRDGDDFSGLDTGKVDSKGEKGKTPFRSAMIVPLILRVVAVDPAVTNKSLRFFLEQYRKLNFMIDAILQEACTQACMELFGTPSTNVKYAEAVMNEMKAQGHIVRMKITTRKETLKNIKRVVISEELLPKTPMNERSFGTTGGRKRTES
jgi:hypothetical protein